jgi:hypothetical protein
VPIILVGRQRLGGSQFKANPSKKLGGRKDGGEIEEADLIRVYCMCYGIITMKPLCTNNIC